MFMRDRCVIWLPSRLHDDCLVEADRFHRLETGGALMGYRHGADAVITTIIGAGPDALHERHNFEPDQEWQVAAIARHYEASGRRETYIGDWHTHPDAKTAHLSWTDRRVLRRIINTPSARAPNPVMIVFYGAEADWQATGWLAALKPRPIIWPKLLLRSADLRLY
jgi:integrative and conjugative element protein (TIGR02256 family)